MAEANDQIGIARAAFFPSLIIGATGGFDGNLDNKLVQLAQPFLGGWAADDADSL